MIEVSVTPEPGEAMFYDSVSSVSMSRFHDSVQSCLFIIYVGCVRGILIKRFQVRV